MSRATARELADTVAIVTGGTSGIGLETAARLAEAGVPRLVLVGRDSARGGRAVAAVHARARAADVRFHAADVERAEAADGLARATVEAFGRIDLLVAFHGGNAVPKPFQAMTVEEIERAARDPLLGVMHACRAVLPAMVAQGGGAIVTMASDAAKVATPGESVIGAAMAAIVMLSRTLAIELRRHGIRVNCVTPSIVEATPFHDRLMADPFAGRLFAKAKERAGLGVVQPADLAALVVYLASPAAARLTGQAISVNGGISAA
jgi:gluconate 5-dehydrogenase/3-oxoacyl-[acyl-carrier protein] reductase